MQLFSSDAATFLKDIYISFAPKNMKLVLCTGLKWGGGVPPGGSYGGQGGLLLFVFVGAFGR